MALPSTPLNFNVQQGNGQVYLSWSILAGATSYTVQRSPDGVTYSTLASASTNGYLDSSVTVGTLYYYQVAAVNGTGTGSYTTPQSVVPTYSAEVSLGQVRLMSQQRADLVGSNYVTIPEWNSYINQSYFELYDLLITVYEDYYLAEPIQITPDGTTQKYALPNGANYNGAPPFYKLMGVDCGLGNSSNFRYSVEKFNFEERNKYNVPNLLSPLPSILGPQYRVMGSNIIFIPAPASGQAFYIWYIPRLTQLLQDTDILDAISGWSEYVIVDSAIKALQKEESDVSVLMSQKEALRLRIMASATNRDAGAPDTITDIRWRRGGWGDNGTGNYGGF